MTVKAYVVRRYGVIVMLFIFFAFYDIALTPLAIGYPVEILPYKARAKGMGITFFGIYGALVFNNYANPLALEAIGYYYYIVYGELRCQTRYSDSTPDQAVIILAVMLVVVYFYFPETRGKTLEEVSLTTQNGKAGANLGKIAVVFDGEAGADDLASPAEDPAPVLDEKIKAGEDIDHAENIGYLKKV